jgi:hypothetical protein
LSVLTFEKYTLDLADARDVTAGRVREPQERYLGELLFPREDEISSIGSERTGSDTQTFRNSLRLEGDQRVIAPPLLRSRAVRRAIEAPRKQSALHA